MLTSNKGQLSTTSQLQRIQDAIVQLWVYCKTGNIEFIPEDSEQKKLRILDMVGCDEWTMAEYVMG